MFGMPNVGGAERTARALARTEFQSLAPESMTNPPSQFPTREQIRAKATEISGEILRAAASGINPRQRSLDLLDEQAKYAESLGPENVDRYLSMLSQELEALNATANEAQAKVNEVKVGKSAWMLGAVFGAMIGLPLIFRACS